MRLPQWAGHRSIEQPDGAPLPVGRSFHALPIVVVVVALVACGMPAMPIGASASKGSNVHVGDAAVPMLLAVVFGTAALVCLWRCFVVEQRIELPLVERMMPSWTLRPLARADVKQVDYSIAPQPEAMFRIVAIRAVMSEGRRVSLIADRTPPYLWQFPRFHEALPRFMERRRPGIPVVESASPDSG